jgi:hypothetical protein
VAVFVTKTATINPKKIKIKKEKSPTKGHRKSANNGGGQNARHR